MTWKVTRTTKRFGGDPETALNLLCAWHKAKLAGDLQEAKCYRDYYLIWTAKEPAVWTLEDILGPDWPSASTEVAPRRDA